MGVAVAAGVPGGNVARGVKAALGSLLTVGAKVGMSIGISDVGAARWSKLDPPVKIKTVPRTILNATKPLSPNDAYQRQSLFFNFGFALRGIVFLSLSVQDYTTDSNENKLTDCPRSFIMPSHDRGHFQVKPADEHAKQLQAQISTLREITRAISAVLSLDQILSLITRKTARVMDVDSCSIYLLDDGKEFLVLKATTGLAPEAIGHAHLKIGEGLTGHAAKIGKPVAASRASRDPHFKYLPETKEAMFQSLLAVPLVSRDHVIGAINVQTKEGREYSPDEIELLSIIADVAAGVLEKAMLYEEIGGLKEAIETRKLVERAKGFLMKRHAIGEEDAFKRIQHQARSTRKTMREIAEAIILAEEV